MGGTNKERSKIKGAGEGRGGERTDGQGSARDREALLRGRHKTCLLFS